MLRSTNRCRKIEKTICLCEKAGGCDERGLVGCPNRRDVHSEVVRNASIDGSSCGTQITACIHTPVPTRTTRDGESHEVRLDLLDERTRSTR